MPLQYTRAATGALKWTTSTRTKFRRVFGIDQIWFTEQAACITEVMRSYHYHNRSGKNHTTKRTAIMAATPTTLSEAQHRPHTQQRETA